MFTRAYRTSRAFSLSPVTMNVASAKLLGSSPSFSFFEIKPPQFLHSVFKSSDLCVALLRTSFLIQGNGNWAQYSSRRLSSSSGAITSPLTGELSYLYITVLSFAVCHCWLMLSLWSTWRCFSISHNFLACHSSHCGVKRIIIFFRSLYLSLLDCILFFRPFFQFNNLLILILSSSVTADFRSLKSSGIFINKYFTPQTRKINLPCPLVSHWLLLWVCNLFAKPILRNFLVHPCHLLVKTLV